MALTVMKVLYKNLKPNAILYQSYITSSNEAFIVDIQKRTFQLIFLKQLLVKLFNDIDMFNKKSTVNLLKNNDISTEGQDEIVKEGIFRRLG